MNLTTNILREMGKKWPEIYNYLLLVRIITNYYWSFKSHYLIWSLNFYLAVGTEATIISLVKSQLKLFYLLTKVSTLISLWGALSKNVYFYASSDQNKDNNNAQDSIRFGGVWLLD